jgi:calcineurin-like phosphoesterase family protein
MFGLFKKPKRWFTSDWHWGHRNVIPYCNRPWKDIEEMNLALVEIWNSHIKPKDTVYYLGDFALNSKKYLTMYSEKLNGNKFFISGNHDWTHPAMCKSETKFQKHSQIMKDLGWKEVYRQSLELNLKNGYKVLLNHFPYLDETSEFDLRYKQLRPENKGKWLIHGHLHGIYRKKGRMIDVAFDGDLKPWSEDEIIELIKDKRDYIETPISEFYRQRNKKVLE